MMFKCPFQLKAFSGSVAGKCFLEGNICASAKGSNIYIKISVMFSNPLLTDRDTQLYERPKNPGKMCSKS